MNDLILAFNHEQVPGLIQEWHINWMKRINLPTSRNFAVHLNPPFQGGKLAMLSQHMLTKCNEITDTGKSAGTNQIKRGVDLKFLSPTAHREAETAKAHRG